MRKLLKLAHHRHTGRHLPHYHTSYRALFVVFGVLAVCGLWMQRVHALDYAVHASVAAEMPPYAPAIVNPTNNTIVGTVSNTLTISGSCPIATPNVIVVLKRDNQTIGSGDCVSGAFSIPISLVLGVNTIIPYYVTIVGDNGPIGDPIRVSYTPPAPIKAPPVVPVAQSPTRLELFSNTPFVAYKLNQSVTFSVSLKGGIPPYALSVDWGDGNESAYAVQQAGERTLTHIYTGLNQKVIRIRATDVSEQTVRLQVAAVTTTLNVTYNGGPISREHEVVSSWTLYIVWATYGVALVAVLAFWAGQNDRKLNKFLHRIH